jgi:hypothetical protein
LRAVDLPRRRLGKPLPVVPISDARAGLRAPASGAPSPLLASASRKMRFTRRPGTRAGRIVFSDRARTPPRASRPLARCGGYPLPHRNRVESMLGRRCRAPMPTSSPRRACDPARPEPGVPAADPPAGGCLGEMRRARTCEPSLSKSTRISPRLPRGGPTRPRVSSPFHGALPASATSLSRETGVFVRSRARESGL